MNMDFIFCIGGILNFVFIFCLEILVLSRNINYKYKDFVFGTCYFSFLVSVCSNIFMIEDIILYSNINICFLIGNIIGMIALILANIILFCKKQYKILD